MSPSEPAVTFLPCGDTALSVRFGVEISDQMTSRVLALDAALRERPPLGVCEMVPSYCALLIHFDPVQTGLEALAESIRARLADTIPAERPTRRWRVPVVYGGEFGIDIAGVAHRAGLSIDAVVERHLAADYRIAMIGFTPGYCYLSGLDWRLTTPRLTTPRPYTPSGSIAIGGSQASIQGIAAPSGWHLIGRTPVMTFAPHREPVFLMQPGDTIRFHAIDASAWPVLAAAAGRGEMVAELAA
jgi:KipI family sensor histidine kinase inhibitor